MVPSSALSATGTTTPVIVRRIDLVARTGSNTRGLTERNEVDEEEEYPNLEDEISFEGFDFAEYVEHEQIILKPRMEAKGYSSIVFAMGEEDELGPLIRLVQCVDADGNDKVFMYA
jgi:hypothetical protein